MKRVLPLAFGLCLALSACATTAPTAGDASAQQTASAAETYTNIGNDADLGEVASALLDAGLPEADVDAFAAQVRSLNDVAPPGSLVTAPTPLADAVPDDGTVSAATEKQPRLTNCRMTTFTLAHSLITVGDPEGADTSQLFVDEEQIAKAPALFGDSLPAFDAVYGRIPTTREKDPAQRAADIEKYTADHGIAFAHSDASVISVYIHDTLDPQAYSFIGHTGVLVEADDGLLFVEKLAFDAPYRAIRFDSREQLRSYLMSMYDDGPDMDYGQPLIFENGEEMAS